MLLMQWKKIFLIFFYRERKKKNYTLIFVNGKESFDTAPMIKIKSVKRI